MLSEKSYPWFFFYRIARLSLLVFLPTLFIILFLYRGSYKEGLVSQMSIQIEENLKTTKQTLEVSNMSWNLWCESIPHSETARYSLIDEKGKIICDSRPAMKGQMVQEMDEVTEALQKDYFSHLRYSDIFATQSVFGSLKISDQMVLRKVVPITSLKNDMGRFDRVLFYRIIPFALCSYLLFLFLFYRSTRPLGMILSKVEKFKANIPFGKSLELLYKKDEWAQIEEALNGADKSLREQVVQTKNENEKITAILESINDSIIAIDPFETVLFFNTNFRKNFMKERSQKEIVPKIWHTFSKEAILETFRHVLKEGKTLSLKAIHCEEFRQSDHIFDLTVTPLRDSNGKISGALGVFYDVTEFKRTEQMRVDFVANVSHEIRTPLTSIKGYTQILQAQSNKLDPDLRIFMEKILSNTERMISLFNDLLNLSVIEAQNLERFEELELQPLVEEISHNIETNYPQKKVNIEHDLKLQQIKGDQRLMEQVLTNLIDNACKYAGDEISIKISSFAKDTRGFIVVSDNGPGISREHLARIFERFYRVDSSRESSRGTGLGLSIVKHIIAKHGGKIWAESVENHGTNFIIELPLA